MNILKKIKILLLAAVFTAGCTVIIYESPIQRARSTYIQHWQHCPYGSFWGNIYWQYMWYYRNPYYSRILTGYDFRRGYRSKKVITKRQLQKPSSTSSTATTSSTKVSKKKVSTTSVSKVKRKTSEKTVKKKK